VLALGSETRALDSSVWYSTTTAADERRTRRRLISSLARR
jgi:hypothetical protein